MLWQFPVALAGLLLLASPSAADDRKDCFSASHSEASIAACTRLLSTGGMRGSDLAGVHNFRGVHYLGLRQYDPAIADFDIVIRLQPQSALAFSNRSLSYQGKGDHARAISDMSVALALEPNAFADRWYVRGDNHERRRQLSEALADYGVALKLDPKHQLSLDGVKRVTAKLSSDPASVPPKPSQSGPAASRDRVALVAGIGAYKNAEPLPNPSNDASDIAAALRKLGFDVMAPETEGAFVRIRAVL